MLKCHPHVTWTFNLIYLFYEHYFEYLINIGNRWIENGMHARGGGYIVLTEELSTQIINIYTMSIIAEKEG